MLVFYCFCICKILRRRRRWELHTLLTTHYSKFQSVSCRCMHASQTHMHAISVALHFAVDIQPTMTAPCFRSKVVFVFTALECEAFLSISHPKWQTSGCRCSQFNLLCAIAVADIFFALLCQQVLELNSVSRAFFRFRLFFGMRVCPEIYSFEADSHTEVASLD